MYKGNWEREAARKDFWEKENCLEKVDFNLKTFKRFFFLIHICEFFQAFILPFQKKKEVILSTRAVDS